jgi:transcription elongation factor GreA
MAEVTTWLTQEAHDRLAGELQSLIDARPDIAAEINARREEGDLRENGGYQAARDEQAKHESRIRQLQELLGSAQVGHPPIEDGTAGPGMIVTVRYEGDDETETFLIGSREEAGTANFAVYSPASPLGTALDGAKEGDTVSYTAPTGATIKLTLLKSVPFAA